MFWSIISTISDDETKPSHCFRCLAVVVHPLGKAYRCIVIEAVIRHDSPNTSCAHGKFAGGFFRPGKRVGVCFLV